MTATSGFSQVRAISTMIKENSTINRASFSVCDFSQISKCFTHSCWTKHDGETHQTISRTIDFGITVTNMIQNRIEGNQSAKN